MNRRERYEQCHAWNGDPRSRQSAGLIVADSWDAAIHREFQPQPKMAPARRKALVLRYAKLAGQRLHRIADPDGVF